VLVELAGCRGSHTHVGLAEAHLVAVFNEVPAVQKEHLVAAGEGLMR
jgi:hypothetical protein